MSNYEDRLVLHKNMTKATEEVKDWLKKNQIKLLGLSPLAYIVQWELHKAKEQKPALHEPDYFELQQLAIDYNLPYNDFCAAVRKLLQGRAKPAQEEKIPPELENYSRFLDKQMDEIAQEEITDAERYQALKVRAHFVDESGGWSGHFRIANIPARETGPWAKSHGGEYDHKTLDEAINALIRASKGEKT